MVRSPMFDVKACGGRVEASLRTGAFLGALFLVIAMAALAGGLLARQLLVARPPLTTVVAAGHLAEAGGLLLRIDSIAWERPDPTAEPAHAVFIDGRPARYLQLRIALQNPTERSQAVTAQEFRLQARTGTVWASEAGSGPPVRLGPKEALSSVLVFDVPVSETALLLVWTREGQELRIPLAVDAPTGKEG